MGLIEDLTGCKSANRVSSASAKHRRIILNLQSLSRAQPITSYFSHLGRDNAAKAVTRRMVRAPGTTPR